MQILSIYRKNVLESAMSGSPARLHAHTSEERLAFEHRMAALRTADRRFIRRNG